MKYKTKRLTTRAFLIYTAINVIAYVFAHIAYLYANEASGEVYEYFSYYLSKSLEFIAPPILATLTYLVYKQDGVKRAIAFSASVSSARVFYSLPYYYIIFIYNHGYDSLESICLSLAASVLVVLLTVLGTLVCVTVSLAVMRYRCRKCDTPPALATEMIMKKHPTPDFLAIGNTPILTFALLRFAFSFTMELIDTISFFIAYRSDYLPKEIITILVNFTLLFVLLVASYLVASAVRNALIKSDEEAGE
jgi:hypothetical protein